MDDPTPLAQPADASARNAPGYRLAVHYEPDLNQIAIYIFRKSIVEGQLRFSETEVHRLYGIEPEDLLGAVMDEVG